jgi:flagellar protein FliJ
MGPFVFALEPLLELRVRVEKAKQSEFAARARDLATERRELERLNVAQSVSMMALGRAALARPALELRLADQALRQLARAIDAQHHRCQEVQIALERSRGELVVASRERRVLEKLKERRRRSFDAEEARREELELDEGNARRHERRRRERIARAAVEGATR